MFWLYFYLHMVTKFRNTIELYCCLYHLVENMDPVVYALYTCSQSFVITHSQKVKTQNMIEGGKQKSREKMNWEGDNDHVLKVPDLNILK